MFIYEEKKQTGYATAGQAPGSDDNGGRASLFFFIL